MDLSNLCSALNISDEKRCLETATSVNGLFCTLHSKQALHLYRGYKKRNAELDKLDAKPPVYFVETKIPLSNQTFADVDKEELCLEIHSHLLAKFQLLDRVIKARKLHTSRFFSMNYDYGHAKFLDSLQGQKATVQKAMERLERRTAEVLYENQKWFHWVRECQDEEEKSRDKEQKKIKLEAAMFRRNKSMMDARMKERKEKESKRRENIYLEQVYKERMREVENEEDDTDGEMDWDPIEDVLEDTRGAFLDLIHHFLWMPAPVAPVIPAKNKSRSKSEASVPVPTQASDKPLKAAETVSAETKPSMEDMPTNKSKSKKKKKKKTSTIDNTVPETTPEQPKQKEGPKKQEQQDLPDKSLIETKEELTRRLREGSDLDTSSGMAVYMGRKDGAFLRQSKTLTFAESEINPLLDQVSEIKNLLFCRLLLGHATLLPAALRASSVEEFLADEEVTGAALRDICLKMENPGLQEIRDACADFFRSEDEPDDEDTQIPPKAADDKSEVDDNMIMKPKKLRSDLPEKWISKREKAKAQFKAMPVPENLNDLMSGEGTAVEFGAMDQPAPSKKVRVKICGRQIWNYPSNQAMTRGGWLHFCIIAKDSSLFDAVSLCRHWDEFFELNTLLLWKYFPAAKWLNWVETPSRQAMLQLGFIIYAASEYPDAMELSKDVRNGGRNGLVRRSHAVAEYRNFICAHIKRDDQVSRRLVQYLSMQSHCLLVLVRDAETGKLLITPPEAERWLMREKSGLGRAAKNEWKVHKSIGPAFFEEVDRTRKWSFSFKEYYDVYIWDLLPGYSFPSLYNVLHECIYKAYRFTQPNEIFDTSAHILRTICHDPVTNRNRDIKPGEKVKSVLDGLKAGGVSFHYGEAPDHRFKPETQSKTEWPRNLFYSQADILEDEILFPEEHIDGKFDPMNIGKISPLRVWETEGFSLKKFVENWDSDSTTNQHSEGEDEEDEWSDEDDEDDDEDSEAAEAKRQENLANFDPAAMFASLGISPAQVAKGAKKLSERMGFFPKKSEDERMQEDFMLFLDKEKSRIFKEVWHKADLAPHAQSRYMEMMNMYKAALKWNRRVNKDSIATTILIEDRLELPFSENKDLDKAYAKIVPYFRPQFFASKYGEAYKDSLLFDQEKRAKNFIPGRSHHGNASRDKDFWKDLDTYTKTMKDEEDLDKLPVEWDVAVRPIIAQLYKSGVLRNRADHYHEGQAIAHKEPQRPDEYDFFIDFRGHIGKANIPASLENPATVPPLLTTAQSFAVKHPTAKFSVLTLWSAPHFYPLMIGPDNHDSTSFRDLVGRCWIWMFVPKDLAYSEYSIHHTAKMRITPYKKFFKDKVVVKRDKYLVMGVNKRECELLTAAAVQAIQGKPWRWEVDLWKSFVNVDGKFLDGLEGVWWE